MLESSSLSATLRAPVLEQGSELGKEMNLNSQYFVTLDV